MKIIYVCYWSLKKIYQNLRGDLNFIFFVQRETRNGGKANLLRSGNEVIVSQWDESRG